MTEFEIADLGPDEPVQVLNARDAVRLDQNVGNVEYTIGEAERLVAALSAAIVAAKKWRSAR